MQTAPDQKPFRPDLSSPALKDPAHALSNWKGMASGRQYGSPNPDAVEGALRTFVDQFEEGLAVVDKCGRALFLNAAAKQILDGTHLRLLDGYLRANSSSGSMALRKMIDDCAVKNCGGSLRLVSGCDTLLIAASAIPFKNNSILETSVLLRLINPATALLPSESALRAQFGFTHTEAALALEMLAGNDLAACAIHRGITLNTARAHLRSMFDKTETCRQASLIRLLLLCPRTIMGQAV
ncbi:helix-turn-helix transcriptional regulator [Methylobacterium sp. P1-11]|uniref:helix-turn-helix transcriptional regulator n=1 Tax=Methylobacterium sp. P1-11 TaxID=2024616 RepID=UPI0011EC40E3|nr:helix-turn-helix transcriptional regulator [Methylobacterium sp. P1-11]